MPCGARQRLHQRVGITRHFYAGVYAISVRDLLYAGDKIFFRRIERIIGSQLQRKRPAMLAKVRSYYRIGAAPCPMPMALSPISASSLRTPPSAIDAIITNAASSESMSSFSTTVTSERGTRLYLA